MRKVATALIWIWSISHTNQVLHILGGYSLDLNSIISHTNRVLHILAEVGYLEIVTI